MTKEEILLLLREVLSVRFDKNIGRKEGDSKLTVRLFLYDEEISSDFQIIKEAE